MNYHHCARLLFALFCLGLPPMTSVHATSMVATPGELSTSDDGLDLEISRCPECTDELDAAQLINSYLNMVWENALLTLQPCYDFTQACTEAQLMGDPNQTSLCEQATDSCAAHNYWLNLANDVTNNFLNPAMEELGQCIANNDCYEQEIADPMSPK